MMIMPFLRKAAAWALTALVFLSYDPGTAAAEEMYADEPELFANEDEVYIDESLINIDGEEIYIDEGEAYTDERVVYTDENGQILTGAWRYEDEYFVFDDEGHLLAGGGARGSKGRLYIPSADVDVAVNFCNNENIQDITDLNDSAAYAMYRDGKFFIADHNTQSFSLLHLVSAGSTAYLITDKGIEAFECIGSFAGHNTGEDLTDEYGDDLTAFMPRNGFTAYTCLDNWTNILVTFWGRTWIAGSDESGQAVRLEMVNAEDMPMEEIDDDKESRRRVVPIIMPKRPGDEPPGHSDAAPGSENDMPQPEQAPAFGEAPPADGQGMEGPGAGAYIQMP